MLQRLNRRFANRWQAERQALRNVSSTLPPVADANTVSFVDMAYGNPLHLPRLPIPHLDDTISRYLQSLEPLTRGKPDELARAEETCNAFLSGDGPGLHAKVVDMDKSRQAYPYSYIEQLWDDMYLEGRWSLPINSNPYLALRPDPQSNTASDAHDRQITGATRFLSSFLKWNRRVRSGNFEADSPPGCLHGYALQAGSARIARKGRDEVQYHPASRHAVVFCNNRVYRVNLLGGEDGQSQVSDRDLSKALEDIRSSAFSEPYGPSPGEAFVGHLTSKDRNEWAMARDAMEGFSPVNAATLYEIDSALLAVALDDKQVADESHEGRSFLTGDCGRNRWFDKHQLVVLKNGAIAVNFEHSFSDGVVWTRMLTEIWHDMYNVQRKGVRSFPEPPILSSPPAPPRELVWKLPSELKGEIQFARREFEKTCSAYSLDMIDFRDFGKNDCKKWMMSPDAVAQMAFQLAYRRLHEALAPTYESCTTRSFFRGRTETIRSCTSASADFISAMMSEATIKDSRRQALKRAASTHVAVAKAAQQGQGIDRHIYALRAARETDSEGEAFFNDPLMTESCTWRLSTSNLSVPCLSAFGFGPVVSDGYGLGYIVGDEFVKLPVTAFTAGGNTDGSSLATEITRALRDIGDVCR